MSSTWRELRATPRAFWPVVIGVALVLAGIVASIALVFTQLRMQGDAIDSLRAQRNTAVQEKDATGGALDEANDKLVQVGEAPVHVPTATAVPGAPGTTGAQGDRGPGPSDAQVRSAVTAVLEGNPSLTAPQIASQVAVYLRDNPPADGADGNDGRDATDTQITAAVVRWMDANKATLRGLQGAPGRDGVNAPAVTAEQLAAAAAAALAANPAPAGPVGPSGAPGVGVSTAVITDCLLTITLTDGRVLPLGNVCGPQGETGPQGPPGDTVTVPPTSPPTEAPRPEPTTDPPAVDPTPTEEAT